MERTLEEPGRKNEYLEHKILFRIKPERQCWRSKIHGKRSKEMVLHRSKEEQSTADNSSVQELNVKLQLLEDDTRAMKEALFRCMKERDTLMKEVTQKFHNISNSMEPSSGSSKQDIRKIIGLSEILPQGSNSSLVTRDLKVILR